MQKALIIKAVKSTSDNKSIDNLNEFLAQGWTVLHTCSMPSSASENDIGEYPTCLVIIEKD